MVNINMSKILMGSSVKRRKKHTDNLVDKRKVYDTEGDINTLTQLYSASHTF